VERDLASLSDEEREAILESLGGSSESKRETVS
jgi:hypothetical protein